MSYVHSSVIYLALFIALPDSTRCIFQNGLFFFPGGFSTNNTIWRLCEEKPEPSNVTSSSNQLLATIHIENTYSYGHFYMNYSYGMSTMKFYLPPDSSVIKVFLPPASAVEVIESEPCVCVSVCEHSHGQTV